MQRWEHCELVGKTVTVLGKGMFRKQFKLTEHGAWDELGDKGWELVSVVPDGEGELHYYFKRSIEPK
jgi:hypothetical protein